MRAKILALVEHPWFSHAVLAVILANAVTLGLETSRPFMREWGHVLYTIDFFFIAFFVAELTLKLIAYRTSFFRQGWNVFDAIIVVLTLLPFFGNLSVLRALRILRVLRLLSIVPRFRLVVAGFFDALGGLAAVAGILLILLYVAAVLASKLFGDAFPMLFGSLPRSLLSMFQIVTLEGWMSDIARPVMAVYQYAWMFFVPFIAVTTFTIFNLLIGIIVNSMQHIAARQEEANRKLLEKEISTERQLVEKVEAMEKVLGEVKQALQDKSR